jgi:hypothetical protein
MDNTMKRGQIILEFMIIVCIALIILILFLKVIEGNVDELNNKNDIFFIKEIAYKVKYEISTASEVKQGYKRNFVLPEKLDKKDYTIEIQENELITKMGGWGFVLKIPETRGNIIKGNNSIENIGGVVYLN